MPRVLVPLAPGCESSRPSRSSTCCAGRRSSLTAGLAAGSVTGSRGTVLLPDATLDEALQRDYDMVVLPGGQPGANNPERTRVSRAASAHGRSRKAPPPSAPLCAAAAGLLEQARNLYPGARPALARHPARKPRRGAGRHGAHLARPARLWTSRALIEILIGRERRDDVEQALMRLPQHLTRHPTRLAPSARGVSASGGGGQTTQCASLLVAARRPPFETLRLGKVACSPCTGRYWKS